MVRSKFLQIQKFFTTQWRSDFLCWSNGRCINFKDRGNRYCSDHRPKSFVVSPWGIFRRRLGSDLCSFSRHDFRGQRCTLAAALPRTKEVGWKANLFLLRIPSCGEGRRGRQDRGWVGWPLWCNRTEIVCRCTKRDRAIMRRGLDRTCISDSRWNPCYI